MVKTCRINTVSFSFSNIAKNGLVVKPGDILTLVKGDDGQMYVDLATPNSIIRGICDDRATFPDTNETKEQYRVNYTPVAWDNTYKIDKSSDTDVKIGYFYKITADGKLDTATGSDSVGQIMVQDITDSYVEVRFVSNQGLFVPQYSDTRLESIEETNPSSDPFDGQYTFTLSDGTKISGDFSSLAWYLGDVEITGKLTVDQDTQIKGDTLIEKTLEVSEGATIGGNTSVDGNITATGNAEITGSLTAGTTEVASLDSTGDVHIEGEAILDRNLTVEGYASITGDISSMGKVTIAETLTVGQDATVNGNTEIKGTLKSGDATLGTIVSSGTISASGNITGNNITGANGTLNGTLNVTNGTVIGGTLGVDGNITGEQNIKAGGNLEVSHSADIDEDLNVDGELHVGGSAQIDEALHAKKTLAVDGNTTLNGNVIINGNLSLGADSEATQFVLQSEKNQPNGVAGLNLEGKISSSVLPDGIYPKFYYETSTQGSRTYTLQHEPVSDSSIMVFSDSGTAMFPTIDYTCANGQITFVNMETTEYAIIRVIAK